MSLNEAENEMLAFIKKVLTNMFFYLCNFSVGLPLLSLKLTASMRFDVFKQTLLTVMLLFHHP